MSVSSVSIAFARGATSSTMQLLWILNGGATSLPADYQIQAATDAGFTQNVLYFTVANSGDTFGPLYRATNYFFRVRGHRGSEYSAWSKPYLAATLTTTPGPTQPYYIDAQGQNGIHYLFNGPADDGGTPVREYQVGYGTDPNNVQATFNPNGGDAWINGLNRYTLYYVWSRARNDNGWGPWSNRFEQRTRAYVPAPPSPLGIDNVTQRSLRYRFRGEDNGGADILEWQVGWGTDPNYVQNYVGYSNGETTLDGLTPFTTYYVWSRGRNVEGWGQWSNRSDARTQAGARVRTSDGQFYNAIPYVKENGVWRVARPYIKRVGLWKTTE